MSLKKNFPPCHVCVESPFVLSWPLLPIWTQTQTKGLLLHHLCSSTHVDWFASKKLSMVRSQDEDWTSDNCRYQMTIHESPVLYISFLFYSHCFDSEYNCSIDIFFSLETGPRSRRQARRSPATMSSPSRCCIIIITKSIIFITKSIILHHNHHQEHHSSS